jgi:hypothetical protein
MMILFLFSPSLVLFAWAGLVAIGCKGVALTVTGLVLLAVALAFHVHAERKQHHVP